MRGFWFALALVVAMAGTASALSVPGAEDEVDRNRALLEKYRLDPEHFNRLKRDWKAFHNMTLDKQARIRALDGALHQENSDGQVRLWRVLERYANWLERLPEADVRRIESAASPEERLLVIQELREGEWVSKLPRAVRERVQNTPIEKRSLLIAELRLQERQRHQEWHKTVRRRQPTRLTDFPAETQVFVNESLRPLLNDEERLRLRMAENNWPLFGHTLIELSDRHPILFPPSPIVGPKRYPDWKELREQLPPRMLDKAKLKSVEGKWPDFALYVTEVARARGIHLTPLGPCRPKDFYSTVQRFIENQLAPALDEADRERLTKTEGKWPEYPHLIVELAKKYDLRVPGMALPGLRELREELKKDNPDG